MTEQDLAFSRIFAIQVEEYNKAENAWAKRKIKEAIKESIKKWSDQPVKMVSKGVMEECSSRSIDPFELMWTKREAIGKTEKGKSRLLWEHTTPVGEFFTELITYKSLEEIQTAIENYSGVCWILREEDDALNANGYRDKRPGGWRKCYEECGIYVVTKDEVYA